jgi:hypothetical protein
VHALPSLSNGHCLACSINGQQMLFFLVTLGST